MDGYQKKANHTSNIIEFEIQHLKQQLTIRNKLFNETVNKMQFLQKELLDLNNFNDQLFQSIKDIIIVTDEQNNIIKINSSLSTVLGFKINDFIGKKIDEFFINSIEEINFKNIENNYSGEFVDKSGVKVPIMISKFNLNNVNNESIGSIYIIKNMTDIIQKELELKKAHVQLKKINYELEERVRIRTKEIHHLLNQKNGFINQLSHDLRTPLTPLVNLLPLLENTEQDPKSKQLFEVLHRSVNRMANIVDKTLKLAKLNAPSTMFDLKDINLCEEAEYSIKYQQLIFNEKELNVENKIDENIFIRADKLQLSEVFVNLIGNAAKYSPPGGTITVDAYDDGDFVTVSIMDSGNGLTSEQIDHIFDEFYKTDESRHDLESSGLGLSICKCIVEKHGGRIWAESPGLRKGSTFYFTLPSK